MTQTETQTVRDIICNKSIKEEQQLSLEFFTIFSQFEYALKQNTRYLQNGRKDKAEANWKKFIEDNSEKFKRLLIPKLKPAIDYIKSNPPSNQICSNAGTTWSKPISIDESEDEFKFIIDAIKVVRNNLFHGGKVPFDLDRDGSLLKHAITILKACLDLDLVVS